MAPYAEAATTPFAVPAATARRPWPASRRWALGIGIAAASLGLLAGLIAAVYALASAVMTLAEGSGFTVPVIEPLVVGERASPEPVEVTDCADPCFGVFTLEHAQPEESLFATLGVPKLFEPQGTYGQSGGNKEFRHQVKTWTAAGGTPDSCFFTYSLSPVAYRIDDEVKAGGDAIYYLSSYTSGSEFSTLYRSVRFFETAEAAGDHLRRLDSLLDECERYTVGSGPNRWSATVTPAPALDVPSTVAAVGWVETGAYSGRLYTMDLLRANAVIRVVLYTDGAITETAFREFVEALAAAFAEWPTENVGYGMGEPQPGFSAPATQTAPRGVCTGECFTLEQARGLRPTAEALALIDGVRESQRFEGLPDSTAGEAADLLQDVATSNAQCRFAFSHYPVVRGNPAPGSAARDDPVLHLGAYGSSEKGIQQLVRVFETEARAQAYMTAIGRGVDLCGRYMITVPGTGDVPGTVTPQHIVGYNSSSDPIRVDFATDHLGWVQSGANSYATHDLRHGNLVVRTLVYRETDDPFTDAELSAFLLATIERLESLQPLG